MSDEVRLSDTSATNPNSAQNLANGQDIMDHVSGIYYNLVEHGYTYYPGKTVPMSE